MLMNIKIYLKNNNNYIVLKSLYIYIYIINK